MLLEVEQESRQWPLKIAVNAGAEDHIVSGSFRNLLPSASTTGIPSLNGSPGQSQKSTSGPITILKGRGLHIKQPFKATLGRLHPWSWVARDKTYGLALPVIQQGDKGV